MCLVSSQLCRRVYNRAVIGFSCCLPTTFSILISVKIRRLVLLNYFLQCFTSSQEHLPERVTPVIRGTRLMISITLSQEHKYSTFEYVCYLSHAENKIRIKQKYLSSSGLVSNSFSSNVCVCVWMGQ